MKTPIKAIIFDFGNVIAKFDNMIFLNEIAEYTDKTADELKRLIYKEYKLPSEYEQGKLTSDEFYKKVSSICGLNIRKDQFIRAYTQIFTPISEVIELIYKLKPKYKIGLLSSTSEWDFEYGFKPIIDTNIFDSITLTYKLGLKKPDPKLFDHATKQLGVSVNETLYIDDLPEVIKSAKDFGMQTILFTNPKQLIQEFSNLKIEISNNSQSYSQQKIVIVDENDKEISYKFRDRIEKEDIFRATGLWITNSDGEILLAKRALTKKINPGKWSAAVAGTVEYGETYEDNIKKEALEELGISEVRLKPYEKTRVRNLHNFFIQWFTLVIDKKAEDFKLQHDEVAEVKWFKQNELRLLLKNNPDMFTETLPQWISLFITKES